MIMTYLRMFAALGLVIGLIYAAAAFAKKRQGKPGILSMLAYQGFGPKKGIALMRLGNDVLLVGVTPTELKLMKIYSNRELELEDTGAKERKAPNEL